MLVHSHRTLTLCGCCAAVREELRMDPPAKRSHHAEKVRSGVPQLAPRSDAAQQGPLSRHAALVCCALLLPAPDCRSSAATARAGSSGPATARTSAWTAADCTSVEVQSRLLQLQPILPRLRLLSSLCLARSICRQWSAPPSQCCTCRA